MKTTNLVCALSLSALVSSAAFAHGGKKEPNCDINGQKEHVKNEKLCTKKNGKWLTPVATTSTSMPEGAASTSVPVTSTTPAATAPVAPAAPVSGQPAK